MFGRGAYDLVDFAMDKWYDQLKFELDDLDLTQIDLVGRLKTGIKTRLSYQVPYQKHWPSAMALGLHPYHFSHMVYRIHKISDHIWYVAGDSSVDVNWYTKRASLSAVYSTTELYMVQDNSKDYRDTWEYLDNRLNNMLSLGHMSGSAQNSAVSFSKGLLSMATTFFPESSYREQADDFEKQKEKYRSQKSNNDDRQSTPTEGDPSDPVIIIEKEAPPKVKKIDDGKI